MPNPQDCRNGCHMQIMVKMDDNIGKYRPFEYNSASGEYDLPHNCPKSPYYRPGASRGGGATTTSFQQKKVPLTTTTSTAGGSTLDTKRILQTLVELTTAVRELKDVVDSRTIIDTNKYEGWKNQLYNAFADYINKGSINPASNLLKQKERQEIMDTSMVHHSDKADQNIESKNSSRAISTKGENIITDADIPDSNEFEEMRKITGGDIPDDFEDDNNPDTKVDINEAED